MKYLDTFPDWFLLEERMNLDEFEFMRLYGNQIQGDPDTFYFEVEDVGQFTVPYIKFEDRYYLRALILPESTYIYARDYYKAEVLFFAEKSLRKRSPKGRYTSNVNAGVIAVMQKNS